MNKEFISYRSITSLNSVNHKKVIDCNGHDHTIPWVAIEKLHGTNFQIRVDAPNLEANLDDIIAGSREGFLETSDKFYGYKGLIDRIKPAIQRVLNNIKPIVNHPKSVVEVILFGEFVGNNIQSQIQYHEDTTSRFYLFDIMLISKNESGELTKTTLGPKVLYEHAIIGITEECDDFRIAPIIGLGGYNELIERTPRTFISTLVAQETDPVGIPLDPDGNFNKDKTCAEGYILRPWTTNYFFTNKTEYDGLSTLYPGHGSWYENQDTFPRMILKVKSPRWKEIERAPRDKSEYNVFSGMNLSEIELSTTLSHYVTENRAIALFSKKSRVIDTKFGEYLNEFIIDVLMDYDGMVEGTPITKLPSKVRRYLVRLASDTIRPIYLDLAETL